MALKTDQELITLANEIRNQTTKDANTAMIIGNMLIDLIQSKLNLNSTGDIGDADTNFALFDLAFTGNREHNATQHDLAIIAIATLLLQGGTEASIVFPKITANASEIYFPGISGDDTLDRVYGKSADGRLALRNISSISGGGGGGAQSLQAVYNAAPTEGGYTIDATGLGKNIRFNALEFKSLAITALIQALDHMEITAGSTLTFTATSITENIAGLVSKTASGITENISGAVNKSCAALTENISGIANRSAAEMNFIISNYFRVVCPQINLSTVGEIAMNSTGGMHFTCGTIEFTGEIEPNCGNVNSTPNYYLILEAGIIKKIPYVEIPPPIPYKTWSVLLSFNGGDFTLVPVQNDFKDIYGDPLLLEYAHAGNIHSFESQTPPWTAKSVFLNTTMVDDDNGDPYFVTGSFVAGNLAVKLTKFNGTAALNPNFTNLFLEVKTYPA